MRRPFKKFSPETWSFLGRNILNEKNIIIYFLSRAMRIYGPENFWLHYLTSNNHQDLEFIFGNKVTDGFGKMWWVYTTSDHKLEECHVENNYWWFWVVCVPQWEGALIKRTLNYHFLVMILFEAIKDILSSWHCASFQYNILLFLLKGN